MSFLPVGHTHNEVDQVASRISVAVRHRDIHTPEHLQSILAESFDDMGVELINSVADSREFLNPEIKKSWKLSRLKEIQNISKQSYFRLAMNSVQHVELCHRTAEGGRWSRPFYPIRGQGDEVTPARAIRPKVPQVDAYGVGAVKVPTLEKREEIMAALQAVRRRVTSEVWERLIALESEIFDTQPVPFH